MMLSDFKAGLAIIETVVPVDQDHADFLFSEFHWMLPDRWRLICRKLVMDMDSPRTPMPKKILSLYYDLSKINNWSDQQTNLSCQACSGQGYSIVFLKNPSSGTSYSAALPCQTCQPNTVIPNPSNLHLVQFSKS